MSFLSTLPSQDLDLLRGIVRKVHLVEIIKKFGPNHVGVSNHECDKLIENIGPEIAERMIRFGADKGLR
jgi:hypothetical protein|tara:strand:+ start:561 stop:767 length:207 start_codon:yes stop_codon:yes gene_type:complete